MIMTDVHVDAVSIGHGASSSPTDDSDEVPPAIDGDHVRTAGIALTSVSAAGAKSRAKHVLGDRTRRQRAPAGFGRN